MRVPDPYHVMGDAPADVEVLPPIEDVVQRMSERFNSSQALQPPPSEESEDEDDEEPEGDD